jgi:hypothetical protein
MTDTGLETRLAGEPDLVRDEYGNKLVLVGVLGRGDVISDLAGSRAGVLWQADAFNDLLLDAEIVPMSDTCQLIMMLLLAGSAAALKLQMKDRGRLQAVVVCLISAAVIVFAIYLYGIHGVLLNPAYCLLAVWVAWWMAGRFGKTWLSN